MFTRVNVYIEKKNKKTAVNFQENESIKYKRNIACIRSGQETAVSVYSGEQAWVTLVFSNLACDYDIMVEVNLKFCKCGSGELCQNIF